MYLSQVRLTEAIGQDSQLGTLLKSNSYGMHRLLWDLFEKDERGRFLFREESSAEQLSTSRNLPLYYMLSAIPPSTRSPLFEVQTKKFAPSLQVGDALGFKLRANPVVARRESGAKNSRRHDVVMDAQWHWLREACVVRQLPSIGKKNSLKASLLEHDDFKGKSGAERLEKELAKVIEDATHKWLADRAERHGFELQSAQATGYRWNALPEKGRDAGFSSMDYEGVIRVTDTARFIEALCKGFGPAKAFGCGLMLIRRI